MSTPEQHASGYGDAKAAWPVFECGSWSPLAGRDAYAKAAGTGTGAVACCPAQLALLASGSLILQAVRSTWQNKGASPKSGRGAGARVTSQLGGHGDVKAVLFLFAMAVAAIHLGRDGRACMCCVKRFAAVESRRHQNKHTSAGGTRTRACVCVCVCVRARVVCVTGACAWTRTSKSTYDPHGDAHTHRSGAPAFQRGVVRSVRRLSVIIPKRLVPGHSVWRARARPRMRM